MTPSARNVARLLSLGLAVCLAAGPVPAHAQQSRVADVSIDFDNMDLEDVIKLIAERTGRNFLYDDRVRGKVTVISPTKVTPEEAFRVFESILQVKGFTTVPAPGGLLKIVPTRDAKESPIETVAGDVVIPNRDVYITRLLPLKYVRADAISNTLRPLISKEANLIAYAPTNTLILTDTASNIRRLTTIMGEIDIETYREQVKVFPIQYADASTLASQLVQIFAEPGTATTPRRATRAAARARPGQPAQAVGALASVIGRAGQPRFITDERTNSIITLATRATLSQVGKIIQLLDYQRRGTGRIHVFRLQNADAEEMAQTLASLTQPGGRGGGGAAGAAAAAAAIAELEGGVRITADAPTNSLIIQASAEGFAAISSVIEALDIRRPQVLVEALIMEVDVTDREAFGIGFLLQTGLNSSRTAALRTGQNVGTLRDPNSIIVAAADLFFAEIFGRNIDIPGLGSVPIIQSIITAAATDADTNIISAPVILTADNEEAEITVGQNIPIITSRIQDADRTSGVSQNIARQDVGVTLRVTPQISEGDTIRLDIFQEISEVVENDPDLGPTTTNRQIQNTVYVSDGDSVMIGGIISEVETGGISKVPFLGDLPVLGWLFKSSATEVRKVNLLLILTPRIVRGPEDLKILTVEGRERFRDQAAGAMNLTQDEKDDRRRALQAGVDLPHDVNPVRRELDRLQKKYPVEALAEMRAAEIERESARIAGIEALKAAAAAGSYLVQTAFYRSPAEAVAALQMLIDEGYDGSVLSRAEQGEVVYYVHLGPYTTEVMAHSVARELQASRGLRALVIVEP